MIPGVEGLETYFMIPEIKGKISLYAYTGESPSDLEGNADLSKWYNYWNAYLAYDRKSESDIQRLTPKTLYVQKGTEPALGKDAMVLKFASQMAKLTADCPELSVKIKSKEKGYKMNDLEKIINEYNACDTH